MSVTPEERLRDVERQLEEARAAVRQGAKVVGILSHCLLAQRLVNEAGQAELKTWTAMVRRVLGTGDSSRGGAE